MTDDAEKRGTGLAAAFLQLQLARDGEGRSTLMADALSAGRADELVAGLSGLALTFGRRAFGQEDLSTMLSQIVLDMQPEADH